MRFLSDKKLSLGFFVVEKFTSDCIVSHSLFPIASSHATIHTNSGACVRLAEEQEISLDALTFEQLQNIDSRFEEDVMKVWDYEMSVERKSSIGGTSKARVVEQIEKCIAFAKTL
jgi:argininosuccinate lyase